MLVYYYYLYLYVSQLLIERKSYPLQDWEIDRIVSTAGGLYKDLDVVLAALFNDRSCWQTVVDRLVADSIDYVELHMERILEQAEVYVQLVIGYRLSSL